MQIYGSHLDGISTKCMGLIGYVEINICGLCKVGCIMEQYG
jgi:hypothetical protein